MTSLTDPQLVTAAEAARLVGVTRQRVLELAASADFPPAEPTPTRDRSSPAPTSHPTAAIPATSGRS